MAIVFNVILISFILLFFNNKPIIKISTINLFKRNYKDSNNKCTISYFHKIKDKTTCSNCFSRIKNKDQLNDFCVFNNICKNFRTHKFVKYLLRFSI